MADVALDINKVDFIFKSLSREWNLSSKTLVMGVLNVTPDSFSDGGQFTSIDSSLVRAIEMVEEGADIIDVGGESSRPGAKPVTVQEELKRVLPVVEALAKKGIAVSVDTTKARVAREVINCGAEIINDISAMESDVEMAEVVRDSGVGVILMHKRGASETMQSDVVYENIVGEVSSYLKERLEFATSFGIEKNKIALDPGIGFGKSVEGNLELLKNIDKFCDLGCPVLIGTSRKSFLGNLLDLKTDERLIPSVATVVASVMSGASIVRVHDVSETVEAVTIARAIMNAN